MIMGVLACKELILSLFDFIALESILVGIIIVVGSNLIGIEIDFDRFRFIRFQFTGLFESDQFDIGLFDAAIGIRGIHVDFDDILTGNRAIVFDIDRSFKLHILAGAGLSDCKVRPLEVGIAKTISERIDDCLVVPIIRILEVGS